MSLILGLGHRSQHGKDYVAAHIQKVFKDKYDIRLYPFARALKLEAYEALHKPLSSDFWQQPYAAQVPIAVLPRDTAVHPRNDDQKIEWVERNKPSLRRFLQLYGTEYRRDRDPFYWVKRTMEAIDRDKPTVAIITDVRFPNETRFIKSRDGFLIKVERIGYTNPDALGHVSEELLVDYPFDFAITAEDGDLAGLRADAVSLFEMIEAIVSPPAYSTADFLLEAA